VTLRAEGLEVDRNSQRRSFSADCVEWPCAVSGCLALAATFFYRSGDYGRIVLVLLEQRA